MFEAGCLLLFKPFLFKNGAMPKDKFFLVLEQMEGEVLLTSLPTSKDHVPSDVEVKHGCLADYGSQYYRELELAARVVRKLFGKN